MEQNNIIDASLSYASYNQKNFDLRHLMDFSNARENRVFIVGDSYAKDFLNIVLESEEFTEYSFSTFQVRSECGIILSEDEDYKNVDVMLNRPVACGRGKQLGDPAVIQRMNDSTEIWLVASWRPWVVEKLLDTVRTLENMSGVPVKIVGPKDFGELDADLLFSHSDKDRSSFNIPVKQKVSEVEKMLQSYFAGDERYFSILDDACGGSRDLCSPYSTDFGVISIDGGHLTQGGARALAQRLKMTLNALRESD